MSGSGMAGHIGRRLRHFRARAGLSQEEVGIRATLHRTEVGLLERGERLPRIDTLIKLAGALEVSPDELVDGLTWKPGYARPGELEIERRDP